MSIVPTVIVHGGAGRRSLDPARLGVYRSGLAEACRAGLERLLAPGGGPLDAAEAAVRAMEASGAFNAGRGSCLNLEGAVECDAAVMVGADGAFGACGAVPGVLHPVTLARRIMEDTEHLLLVGPGAAAFARTRGVEALSAAPSPERLAEWERVREKLHGASGGSALERLAARLRHGAEEVAAPSGAPAIDGGDTVGAVAIDAQGRMAAAVSTGGLWLKLPGRVGDSAILGAGLFADDALGAAVATGIGEVIWRAQLSREVCRLLDGDALDAQAACERACADLATRVAADTAGLIAIDRRGRIGAAMNTEAMGRALLRPGMTSPWVAVARDDAGPPMLQEG